MSLSEQACWQPSASIETLKARARILQNIRAFFVERNVIEVQVPSITLSGVTDLNIDSIPVNLSHKKAYLHTSPEYPMKRLLAAGMSDCYYLGPVYRLGEQGVQHNPEFTMLEWYRLDYEMNDLVNEVIELANFILPSDRINFNAVTYANALNSVTDLDVFSCTTDEVKRVLSRFGVDTPELSTKDAYLDLLMSVVVIPGLSKCSIDSDFNIICLHSYPLSQAALSAELTDENGRQVSGRFEIMINGLEIANGYQECLKSDVLEQRFLQDNKQRRALKKPEMPLDTKFLDAHVAGLPKCSGVALGIDRLCMLALGKQRIDEVIAFPLDRC